MTYRSSTVARMALLAAACVLPLAAQAADQAKKVKPFSDVFAKDTTLNAKWTLAEPNTASSYRLGKKGLLLDASAQNGGSDLWPVTDYNASLLLQPLTSTLNWTVKRKSLSRSPTATWAPAWC